jgi:hypothetical protein
MTLADRKVELAVAHQRGRLSSRPVQDRGNEMARLLSVNVGRPRDIVWKGRTVHTGIWKDPVPTQMSLLWRLAGRNRDVDGVGRGSHARAPRLRRSLDPSVAEIDTFRFVPGRVFAVRFRIVSLLGRGAFGEVYRADDLRLGQPVARAERRHDPCLTAYRSDTHSFMRLVASPPMYETEPLILTVG